MAQQAAGSMPEVKSTNSHDLTMKYDIHPEKLLNVYRRIYILLLILSAFRRRT